MPCPLHSVTRLLPLPPPGCHPTDEDFFAGWDSNYGAVRSRAVAGQGQTVALGRNVMKQNVGQVRACH